MARAHGAGGGRGPKSGRPGGPKHSGPKRGGPRGGKPKQGPKSFKADGTPKKRWTAAERAAKGRPPRRSSGRGHREQELRWGVDGAETPERTPRSKDRGNGERRAQRDDRRDPDREFRGNRAERRRARFEGGRGRVRDQQRDPRENRWGERRRHDGRPHGRHRSDDRAEPADVMEWSQDSAEPAHAANPATTTATTDVTFAELGVPNTLVRELGRQGIEHPFPIQAATIPDALAGRDVLGRGRTGSGKTLGFGLPLVARLAEDARAGKRPGRSPRGLILVPTRELALQVADVIAPLARAAELGVVLVAGGMSYTPQITAFRSGVDIVVATPGRLIDLMKQDAADLTEVDVTVLDEADHMADLGFLPEVTQLLDAVPADGQRLLFSATLDRGVDSLVEKYLHDPLTHQVDAATASVTTMAHHVLHVLPHDKNATTAAIANREGRTVIFVRTQRGADRVAGQLRAAGVMAGALHGGLTQGARSRVLLAFREGTVPVLVATDVAARGIHVDDVTLVLQVDPPMGHKDYLHRAGRTARAGNQGVVATIVLPHQRKQTARLLQHAGIDVEPVRTGPEDDQLAELTGARTPSGDPIPDADYQELIAPRRPARAARPQGRGRFGRGGHGGRGHGGRGHGGHGHGGRGGRGGFRGGKGGGSTGRSHGGRGGHGHGGDR